MSVKIKLCCSYLFYVVANTYFLIEPIVSQTEAVILRVLEYSFM